jgi:hypothetical protein
VKNHTLISSQSGNKYDASNVLIKFADLFFMHEDEIIDTATL